jgi:hypothetical protein
MCIKVAVAIFLEYRYTIQIGAGMTTVTAVVIKAVDSMNIF